MTHGIVQNKVVWLVILASFLGMTLAACGGGGGGGFAGNVDDLVFVQISDAGGNEQTVLDDSLALVGFSATAQKKNQLLNSMTFQILGNVSAADLAGMDFYLVWHGNNGALETSKQLFAPTQGGDDTVFGLPTNPQKVDLSNRIKFEFASPGFSLQSTQAENFTLFADFDDNNPPDVNAFLGAALIRASSETNKGFGVDEKIPSNPQVATGSLNGGQQITVTGALVVTTGTPNANGNNPDYVRRTDTLTDTQFSIRLSAFGENITVSDIRIPMAGTIDEGTAINTVGTSIGLDTDGDGDIDTDFGPAVTVVGSDLVFTGINQQILDVFDDVNNFEEWVVTVQLAGGTATAGQTVIATFDDAADVTAVGDVSTSVIAVVLDGDGDGLFGEGAADTVTGGTSQIVGELTVTFDGPVIPAAMNVLATVTDTPVAHIYLTASDNGSSFENIQINELEFDAADSVGGGILAAIGAGNVTLYLGDGNTAFAPGAGDTLVGGVTLAGNAALFNAGVSNPLATITSGNTIDFWVAVDLTNAPAGFFNFTYDNSQTAGTGVTSGFALSPTTGADQLFGNQTVIPTLTISLGNDNAGADDDVVTCAVNTDNSLSTLDIELAVDSAGPVTVNSIDLTAIYAGNGVTFSSVNVNTIDVHLDSNLDGSINSSALAQVTFVGNTATLTVPGGGVVIGANTTVSLIFDMNLNGAASAADGGMTIVTDINAAGDVSTTTDPNVNKVIGAPVPQGAILEIRGTLTGASSAVQPAAAFVGMVAPDVNVMSLNLAGTDEIIGVRQLVFTQIGTLTVSANPDIANIALHVDGNGNGTFDDTVTDPVVAAGVAVGTTITFGDGINNFDTIPEDGNLDFFVIVDFNGDTEDETIQLMYDDSATVAQGVRSDKSVPTVGTNDFNGNIFTVKPALLISKSVNNPGDSCIFNNATDVQAVHFTLTTDVVSSIDVATFQVTLDDLGTNFLGNADIDAGTVELWLDSDNNGTGDMLLDAGSFIVDGANWSFNFTIASPNVVVTDANPEDLIVIFDLTASNSASGGEMFECSVAVNTDVTTTDANEIVVLDTGANTPTGDTFTVSGFLTVADPGGQNSAPIRNDGTDDGEVINPDRGHHEEVLHFTLVADNAESIDVDTLAFTAVTGGTFDTTAHITTFSLWRSTDAMFDSGDQSDGGVPVAGGDDVLLGSATFAGGTLTFDISGAPTTIPNTGAVIDFYVSMNMLDDNVDFALDGETIQINAANSAISGVGQGSGKTLADAAGAVAGGTQTVHSYLRFIEGGLNHLGTRCFAFDRDTEFMVLHFQAVADNAGNADLTQVTITDVANADLSGAGIGVVLENINSLLLYSDNGADDVFTAGGAENLLDSGIFAVDNGNLTFTGFTSTVTGGTTLSYYVALNPPAAAVVNGDTILINIDDVADFTVSGPDERILDGDDDWIPAQGGGSGEINSSPDDVITNGPITISGTLAFTATPLGIQTLAQNNLQNFLVFLVTASAAGEDFNLTEIIFTAAGSIDESVDVTGASVSIFLDAGQDGTPDGGALATGTFTGDDGTVTLTFAPQTITAADGDDFLVTVALAGTATSTETIINTINAATDITAQGATSACDVVGSGTFPLNGGTCVILSGVDITAATSCGPTNFVFFDGTDEVLAYLTATARAGDVNMTGLVFAQTGTTDESTSIDQYQLWVDDGDNIFEAAQDTLLNTQGGTANNGAVTFAFANTVSVGTPENLWVTARLIGGNASIGGTVITTLADDDAAIEAVDPNNANQDLDRNDAASATFLFGYGVEDNNGTEFDAGVALPLVENLTIVGSLFFAVAPQQPGSENWAQDSQDVPLAAYRISAGILGENYDTMDIGVEMNVAVLLLTNFNATHFQLWVDANNDGLVDVGDTDLGNPASYDNVTGLATWTNEAGVGSTVTPGGLGFVDFLVTVDFPNLGAATNPLKQITANLIDTSAGNCGINIAMNSATSGVVNVAARGTYPVNGNAQTVVGDLEITRNNLTGAQVDTLNNNAQLLVLDLTVNINQEDIEINRLIFNDTGTAHNANDITLASVFWEVDDASGFNGTEALLTSGTYPGEGAPLVLGDVDGGASDLAFVLTNGVTYRLYLVYQLSGNAGNKDLTFDPEISTDTNITATGITTVRPAIIEYPAGTFPVENTLDFIIRTGVTFQVDGLAFNPATRALDPNTDATTDAAEEDFCGATMLIRVDKDNSGLAAFNALTLRFAYAGGTVDADVLDVDIVLDNTAGTDDFDVNNDNTDMTNGIGAEPPVGGVVAVTLDDNSGVNNDWIINGAVAVTEYWWVTVQLGGTASPGETLAVTILNAGDVDFANDNLLVTPFSGTGATATVNQIHREVITPAFTAIVNQPIAAAVGNFNNQVVNNPTTVDIAFVNFGNENVTYDAGDGDGTFTNASAFDPFADDSGVETGLWDGKAADFSKDGDLDLMVTNSTSPATGTVTVFFFDGAIDLNVEGTPDATVTMNSPPFGLCLGDFDNDGDMDGLTALQFVDRIQTIANNNDGTFSPGTIHDLPAASDNPIDVCCTDIDCNGDLDVIVLNINSQNFTVVFGDGDLTFTNGNNIATNAANIDICCGDVDNDGDEDVIVLHATQYEVFLSDGAGAFTAQGIQTLHVDLTAATSIACCDFDLDGDVDFVVGDGAGANDDTHLYLGNDDGTFTWNQVLKLDPNDAPDTIASISLADFDKDGWIDILTVERISNDASIHLNNGVRLDETFTANQAAIGAGTTSALDYLMADLDCDGDMDHIALHGAGGNTVSMSANNDNFIGLAAIDDVNIILAASSTAGGMALGDFNNDGLMDVVAAEGANGSFGVILNTNTVVDTMSFAASVSTAHIANVIDVATGDFDADGFVDVLVLDANGDVLVFLNDGSDGTSFTPEVGGVVAGDNTNTQVEVGDLDSNGTLDAVAVNPLTIEAFNGDGAGTFTAAFADVAEGAGRALTDIKLADMNCDGLLDVIVVDNGDDQAEVFLQQGVFGGVVAGTYVASTVNAFTTGGQTRNKLAVGDVNKDGFPDILVGATARISILIDTDGNGDISDGVTEVEFNSGASGGIQLSDVFAGGATIKGRDGSVDIVVLNFGSSTGIRYENTTVDN